MQKKPSKLLNLKDKLLHWGILNPTDLQLFLNGSNEQPGPVAPRPEPYLESRDPMGVPAVWKGTIETVVQSSIQRVNRTKYLAQLHMHNMTSRGKTTFQEWQGRFSRGFCPLGRFPSSQNVAQAVAEFLPQTGKLCLLFTTLIFFLDTNLAGPVRFQKRVLCFLKGKVIHPLQRNFPIPFSVPFILSIHLNSGNHKSSSF